MSEDYKLPEEELRLDKIGDEGDLPQDKQKIEPIVNKPQLWKPGQSGNPAGRKPGVKTFATLFDTAIKVIARDNKINIKNPEQAMVSRAIVEALNGNLGYFNTLMDRKYGKAAETMRITGGELPVILEISRGRDRNSLEQLNEGENIIE
jgi:hypothetical protein